MPDLTVVVQNSSGNVLQKTVSTPNNSGSPVTVFLDTESVDTGRLRLDDDVGVTLRVTPVSPTSQGHDQQFNEFRKRVHAKLRAVLIPLSSPVKSGKTSPVKSPSSTKSSTSISFGAVDSATGLSQFAEDLRFRLESGKEVQNLEDLVNAGTVYAYYVDEAVREVPGPKPIPFFGNVLSLISDRVAQSKEWSNEYGPAYRLWFFGRPQIVASDADLAKFLTERPEFLKRMELPLNELVDIGGGGLFTTNTEDPRWKLAHKLLMPAFSSTAMNKYIPEMFEIARIVGNTWSTFGPEEDIDVGEWMTRLTFEAIGICGFDFDFKLISNRYSPLHPFIQAMNYTLREVVTRILRSQHWKKLPIQSNRKFTKSVELMRGTVDEVIQDRKVHTEKTKTDLLNYMLKARDSNGEQLSDENIRDQIITFLIAGHETTSNLLSWALYLLDRHPHFEERAVKEAFEVLGNDLNAVPTTEQLSKLQFITQVLKETLRLYPPITDLVKTCVSPCRLPGGFLVEPGQTASIFTVALHRNPKYYERPEDFWPDHFLPAVEAARPRYAYMPFSAGERACIGMQFALNESRVVLSYLLRRFRVYQPIPKEVPYDVLAITLRPVQLLMRLKPRDPSAIQTTNQPVATKTVDGLSQSFESAVKIALSNDVPPVTVAYGSNMGTSLEFAHRIASFGRQIGMDIPIVQLDDWATNSGKTNFKEHPGILIVITSTYNGTPPDNAGKFDAWMDSAKPGSLEGLDYVVFGAGNRQWQTFQVFPRKVDSRFEALGATRFFERGEGDADVNIERDFQEWSARFWAFFQQSFAALARRASNVALTMTENQDEYSKVPSGLSLQKVSAGKSQEPLLTNGTNNLIAKKLQVKVANRLTPPSVEKTTLHLVLGLDSSQEYKAGDYLEVFPENQNEAVDLVAGRLDVEKNTFIEIRAENRSVLGPRSTASAITTPLSIATILTHYADLGAPINRPLLHLFALAAKKFSESDFEALSKPLNSDSTFSSFQNKNRIDSLMKQYPNIKEISTLAFLYHVPLIKPRYYSISSSPKVYPNEAHLTVGLKLFEASLPGGKTSLQGVGLCSQFLTSRTVGTHIYANVKPCKGSFRLPADPAAPMIMVCAGTGIAPFRGFLQEREFLAKNLTVKGETVLFFGCRHPDQDYLYRDELQALLQNGTLTELNVAFSRKEAQKVYVQHLLLEKKQSIWKALDQDKAQLFVCGSASGLAKDVYLALKEVVIQAGGRNETTAEQYLQTLKTTERYIEDVWG